MSENNKKSLMFGYMNEHISKDDIYKALIDGFINESEYQQITGEECPELDIEVIRQRQIDYINNECEKAITSSFYSSVKGEPRLYGNDRDDQSNWQGGLTILNDAIQNGYDSIPDCPIKQMLVVDENNNVTGILAKTVAGVFEPYTYAEYRQLTLFDSGSHKAMQLMKANQLKAVIRNASTIEEIKAVVW